jgi:hypothetical protein
MRIFFALLFLLMCGILPAQDEQLLPLTHNQLQLQQTLKSIEVAKKLNNGSRGGSIDLPFVDDFSTDKFPGNSDGEPVLWTGRKAYRNLTYGINPPTLGVVTFDGADEFGYPYNFNASQIATPSDTLQSVAINLDYPPSANIWFSFFYQGQGWGEVPEPGDSLVLQFYAPNLNQWFHMWSVPGGSMQTFEQVFIPITQTNFLMDNFRFRFVNYATQTGPIDHWHIDYVQLDQNRAENEIIDDVAYQYPANTLLEVFTSMPWKHFKTNPASFMAQNVSVKAFNNNNGNRTILDRVLQIEYEGVLQSTYTNPSDPPIFAQSELVMEEAVNAAPHNFVYNDNVNDTCAIFDVTISNVVTPDLITTNNQLKFKQEFINYYAYDDGSPEKTYSVNLSGSRAAIRYNNALGDSLIGLWIWFEALNNNPGENAFFPFVWESTPQGPGNDLAQGFWSDIIFEPGEFNGWRYYPMIEPVYIPAGPFFVGYTQSVPYRLYVGNDMNTNHNPGRLYYQTTSGWLPTSLEGSIMIRPAFQAPKGDPLSVVDYDFPEVNVFPNPAKDQLNIQVLHNRLVYADLMDITGKSIFKTNFLSSGVLEVSALNAGVYLLRLSTDDGAQRILKVVKE